MVVVSMFEFHMPPQKHPGFLPSFWSNILGSFGLKWGKLLSLWMVPGKKMLLGDYSNDPQRTHSCPLKMFKRWLFVSLLSRTQYKGSYRALWDIMRFITKHILFLFFHLQCRWVSIAVFLFLEMLLMISQPWKYPYTATLSHFSSTDKLMWLFRSRLVHIKRQREVKCVDPVALEGKIC